MYQGKWDTIKGKEKKANINGILRLLKVAHILFN